MMGRAGRPQFDTVGIAVVMVHAPKKNFYKRFLYEPFPVESSLVDVLQVCDTRALMYVCVLFCVYNVCMYKSECVYVIDTYKLCM
jgi:replicative superfamily II helicase